VTASVPCNAFQALSPTWEQSVGGVSESAGAKAGGSNLSATASPSRVVAVKDIPVFWKAALFAGRRRNEDLGRSVSKQRLSSAATPSRR
jgi:hypothetical protein